MVPIIYHAMNAKGGTYSTGTRGHNPLTISPCPTHHPSSPAPTSQRPLDRRRPRRTARFTTPVSSTGSSNFHERPELSSSPSTSPSASRPTAPTGPRPSDLAARAFVGPRRSSVFTTPPRPVYDEPVLRPPPTPSTANSPTKGLSRQTWALRAKILEAEAFITAPKHHEVHPEVCFRAMKGEHLEYSKKTWNGQMERRALLAAQGIEIPDHFDDIVGKVPVDDILDAAAAAWSAWRCFKGRGAALSESDIRPPLTDRGPIWF